MSSLRKVEDVDDDDGRVKCVSVLTTEKYVFCLFPPFPHIVLFVHTLYTWNEGELLQLWGKVG